MSTKILLNGAGRIGKAVLKQLLENKDFEVIVINEINPYIENIVYSINYDSTYGKLEDKFKIVEDNYIQNSKSKIIFAHAEVTSKSKVKFSDLPTQSSIHASYNSKEYQRKVLSGYYRYLNRPISDEDEFLVFEFKLIWTYAI